DWFRRRYRRFVYIDRVVVAAHARGQGLAQGMYSDLKVEMPVTVCSAAKSTLTRPMRFLTAFMKRLASARSGGHFSKNAPRRLDISPCSYDAVPVSRCRAARSSISVSLFLRQMGYA